MGYKDNVVIYSLIQKSADIYAADVKVAKEKKI